jgi:hypothetical protein
VPASSALTPITVMPVTYAVNALSCSAAVTFSNVRPEIQLNPDYILLSAIILIYVNA